MCKLPAAAVRMKATSGVNGICVEAGFDRGVVGGGTGGTGATLELRHTAAWVAGTKRLQTESLAAGPLSPPTDHAQTSGEINLHLKCG